MSNKFHLPDGSRAAGMKVRWKNDADEEISLMLLVIQGPNIIGLMAGHSKNIPVVVEEATEEDTAFMCAEYLQHVISIDPTDAD